ncbi:hypothetical protein P5G51_012165 [Virgibacillus sp. 179-BFC.A HS]|uniref:Sporulation lipoprotein YhcN/YlaJ (Spore_YhcN_YlaJ) n=1 Tax=Tigheibacillus jepli TaxID=3035914 RepID=A0ABU5CKN8_9BACI|nr:hypothetical protein [Virgibacillus sp. 179-BFC.A HS]MDY0406045.1 hypothetical protein [Virgibacillus sp. 179-BFC.A HS]
MKYMRLLPILLILVTILGCQFEKNRSSNTNEHGATNTAMESIDQSSATKAKHLLQKDSRITSVQAVNDSKNLVVAVEVPHMQRFKLDATKKKLNKKMKKQFPDKQLTFSTDKKIYMELEQLSKQIQSQQLTKKSVEKRLKHIIGLSKEQT